MLCGWKLSRAGTRCSYPFVPCVFIYLPVAIDAVLVDRDSHGTVVTMPAVPISMGRHLGRDEVIDKSLHKNCNEICRCVLYEILRMWTLLSIGIEAKAWQLI